MFDFGKARYKYDQERERDMLACLAASLGCRLNSDAVYFMWRMDFSIGIDFSSRNTLKVQGSTPRSFTKEDFFFLADKQSHC